MLGKRSSSTRGILNGANKFFCIQVHIFTLSLATVGPVPLGTTGTVTVWKSGKP